MSILQIEPNIAGIKVEIQGVSYAGGKLIKKSKKPDRLLAITNQALLISEPKQNAGKPRRLDAETRTFRILPHFPLVFNLIESITTEYAGGSNDACVAAIY